MADEIPARGQVSIDVRVSGVVGDWFEPVPADAFAEECGDAEGSTVGFGCRRRADGRLQTTDRASDCRGGESGAWLALRWRGASGESPETFRAHRAVLESRVAAVYISRQRDESGLSAAALAALPFPEIGVGTVRQLEVLHRRRNERESAHDWAMERIVAELYGLSLPELVRLQTAQFEDVDDG